MKYSNLLQNLSWNGYNDPIPSGDVGDDEKAKKYRCPQCRGEMKYVVAVTAPSNPKYNYRGFLVCRNCNEVVETHGYDW
jgi:hypothetical protein